MPDGSPLPGAPLRLLVCGTRFGETYLAALARSVPGVVLAGLLARGSERSHRLARHFGVPLFTDVAAALPACDAAAVVIRAGALGGAGTALAEALLFAGRPVLMEHPLHPTEMQRLLGAAAQARLPFHVNSLYPLLPAQRRFADALRAWRRATPESQGYVEATTSRQLLYSTLDLLGRALGGLDRLDIAPPPAAGRPGCFVHLAGMLAGLDFSLRLQTYLDPRDPDHHSLVMHRIAAGGPEGSIALASSFGPVVISRPLHLPGYAENAGSLLLPGEVPGAARPFLDAPMVACTETSAPTGAEALADALPGAAAAAIAAFAAAVRGAAAPAGQSAEHLLAVARAWLLANQRAGAPVLRSVPPPPPPATIGLAARSGAHAIG